jgi:hypothetical protein
MNSGIPKSISDITTAPTTDTSRDCRQIRP